MKRNNLDAVLLLAGVEPVAVHEIANKYWPDNEHYAEMRRNYPWWLVLTKAGPVVIGWRKRVISIDWSDTPVRKMVTGDDVTKGEDHVHAWGYGKAVEHLGYLSPWLNESPAEEALRRAVEETK